jgi:hypothetical protein
LKPPHIRFGEKTVYYFARQQGWVSVPRDGGNTLGEKTRVFQFIFLNNLDLDTDAVKSLDPH